MEKRDLGKGLFADFDGEKLVLMEVENGVAVNIRMDHAQYQQLMIYGHDLDRELNSQKPVEPMGAVK